MGLVGLGHVGREVARRARALGFTVLGYDPQPQGLRDGTGVELVPLETLLARSDVVSLHARLTPENRRMFSRDRFAQMRPGACFINTARESLVDERALRQALEQGALGGAALDVLEQTPDRHPLLDLPNVFVTPHIGGATAETLTRGAQLAITAVTELLAGRVPANVVNPQVLQAQVEQAQAVQAQVEQAQVEQAQVEQAQVEQAQVEQAQVEQGSAAP
jgi:phosphoglycerate dehydrogenase-like enzyme